MASTQTEDSTKISKRKASEAEEKTKPVADQTVLTLPIANSKACPAKDQTMEPPAAKRPLLAQDKERKHSLGVPKEGQPSGGDGDLTLLNSLGVSDSCNCSDDQSHSEDYSDSDSHTEKVDGSIFTDSEGETDSNASESDTEGSGTPSEPDKTEQESQIPRELAGMSFEELLQLQNKLGTKIYNQVAYGRKPGSLMTQSSKTKSRQNKNRPMEISAKKPVPFLRQVVPVKKQVHRDPRFDDLSGEYKPEIFEKTYSFINDLKKKEKWNIEKQLKKVKDPQRKEQMQQLLQRMEHQEKAEAVRQKQRQRDLEFKKKQRELAKEGKKPYFLKKSEKRTLELADKYKNLQKSGKLESFLRKKRKRNAGKDKQRLPMPKDW